LTEAVLVSAGVVRIHHGEAGVLVRHLVSDVPYTADVNESEQAGRQVGYKVIAVTNGVKGCPPFP
jgi:hypothetical protein